MDHIAVADINTNVVNISALCEEYKIARLKVLAAYICVAVSLVRRYTRNTDTVLSAYVLAKS